MSTTLHILNDAVGAAVQAHSQKWERCDKCDIGLFAHKHVFARGTLPCDILFVGEAPGKAEDVEGIPFVGKAGKLLDQWITAAGTAEVLAPDGVQLMGDLISRTFTYAITNVVLCRPCDARGEPNRRPTFTEIENCRPRLNEFILRAARPKALVLLGSVAKSATPKWEGLPRLNLCHPAYCLRQGGEGCPEDLYARKLLAEFVINLKGTKNATTGTA